jgi:hypothetical protein
MHFGFLFADGAFEFNVAPPPYGSSSGSEALLMPERVDQLSASCEGRWDKLSAKNSDTGIELLISA